MTLYVGKFETYQTFPSHLFSVINIWIWNTLHFYIIQLSIANIKHQICPTWRSRMLVCPLVSGASFYGHLASVQAQYGRRKLSLPWQPENRESRNRASEKLGDSPQCQILVLLVAQSLPWTVHAKKSRLHVFDEDLKISALRHSRVTDTRAGRCNYCPSVTYINK